MAGDRRKAGLDQLSAVDLRTRLASGAVRAIEVAEAHLARIAADEDRVRAWAWHDPGYVRAQAQELDAWRSHGRPTGALHGVPVAIKDIIDTVKIPTENGCALDAGRVPIRDAVVVSRLKQAGALLMGKTATTELAYLDPAPTRNPINPDHTPGGSSSGSAAAVAAGMVPLAIGSQTGGSVIRPASYCGVVGYKPSFGAISRTGMLTQAPSLDTVGVFARTVGDVALLAEVLMGYDPADPATTPGPVPKLFDVAMSEVPVTPALAFVRQPAWDAADEDTRAAFEELTESLGESCIAVDLPSAFGEALHAQRTVQQAELAKSYYGYARRGLDKLGPRLREAIAAGEATLARDYIAALDWPRVLNPALEEIFARFDAIITPAAPGPAPEGLQSTGSAAFNALWTFCGLPAVTIPVLQATNGLPMGVQLVGARGNDGRLLRTARWLAQRLATMEQ